MLSESEAKLPLLSRSFFFSFLSYIIILFYLYTMDHVARLYNTLPSLSEADERFFNREKAFDLISKLLSQHGNVFSVCLVHAHCTLREGEIMLSSGETSQPVLASKAIL